VSAHAEHAWILNCFIPMGWMMRMTQFKNRAQSQQKQVNVGVFDYPALMAADILLYQTDLVPVGADQKQHVELTRDIAERFNSLYGDTFSIPEPVIPSVGGRIMGLSDPTRKMSKSEMREHQAIYLLDSPDEIHNKILKASTDSFHDIWFDETRPGIHNLLVIYKLLTGLSRSEIESRFTGKNYTQLKNELADLIVETLRPIQNKYHELWEESSLIESFLKKGSLKARTIAEATLRLVNERIGIG
jgi:tryptophanyl-tRNA synthetase